MTTHITKTWFAGENVVTKDIPEADIYLPEALWLADLLDGDKPDHCGRAAAELRRLHEEVSILRGDPGNRFAHRLAIELECALLAPEQANADLLDEYHTAVREWMEANGQPYVSGFGKD